LSSSTALGKYQIIREIARSNDIVYEGYDPGMNRRVAVKELVFPTGGTDAQKEDRLKRFEREAKAAGSLTHPGIVTIYEVGVDAGRHYIAMEYLEGRNLRERLDADGCMGVEEAADIICQVLEALQYAHQHGVIHRDIKPDNIQILPDGRVKLTDFGIARLTFEQSITIDGQVFGTPSYMSPEQVVGRDLDARTDIFSCGVVLYEMLTGAKPFAGDSVVTITYNICNTDPASPPGVPYPMEAVIRKALEKAIALRYGGASEMEAAVKEAVRQGQMDSMPMGPQYGPSPFIPQGAIPGMTPPPYVPPGYAPQTPPPYTGQVPQYQTMGQPQQHQAAPIPVYLPPRPRKPLLSPRAKQMLGAMLLTFLIGSAVVGIGAGAVIGIGKYLEGQNARANDARYAEYLTRAQELGDRDPDRAIDIMNQLEEKVQTADYRDRIKRSRAVFYEKAGNLRMRQYRYEQAEQMFQFAIADDPSNPAYYTDMGRLYETLAASSNNREYAVQAAEAWTMAKDRAVGAKLRGMLITPQTC